MNKEQAVAAVIIALISKKNKSRKKQKRKKSGTLAKKKKNLEFFESLLAELRLQKNFEEIFQLIKDDITKENTKMRELIPPRL